MQINKTRTRRGAKRAGEVCKCNYFYAKPDRWAPYHHHEQWCFHQFSDHVRAIYVRIMHLTIHMQLFWYLVRLHCTSVSPMEKWRRACSVVFLRARNAVQF